MFILVTPVLLIVEHVLIPNVVRAPPVLPQEFVVRSNRLKMWEQRVRSCIIAVLQSKTWSRLIHIFSFLHCLYLLFARRFFYTFSEGNSHAGYAALYLSSQGGKHPCSRLNQATSKLPLYLLIFFLFRHIIRWPWRMMNKNTYRTWQRKLMMNDEYGWKKIIFLKKNCLYPLKI